MKAADIGLQRRLEDEAATIAFGRQLAEALPAGAFAIALAGPLGAGKSALARAVLRALGVTDAVPSPTYTLIEPYATARGPAYHVDLYRLHGSEEVRRLGIDEWAEEKALVLVEWPERGSGAFGFDLEIALDYANDHRILNARAISAAGADVLERLQASAA